MNHLTATHRRILWAIAEGGPLSRTETAEMTGMSKPAITVAVRELIGLGLIAERETVQGVGRPAALLSLSEGTSWFAGLSLKPESARLILCDAVGQIAGSADFPALNDPVEIAAALEPAIGQLLSECEIDKSTLRGVGISISGVVNAEQDTCIRSTLMGWENVPLGRLAANRLGLPVHVENDANALAMREKLFGDASEAGSFALADIGDGIGGALFIKRELFRGHSGGAGELAHVTVDPGGLPCRCGKRGCLDTIASARAMKSAARRMGLQAEDIESLEQAAARGDSIAIEILHGAGQAIGLSLAHVIQIVNPERVLVRLPYGTSNGLLTAALRHAVDANVLPQMRKFTHLDIASTPLGAKAAGAASIAAHRFLLAPSSKERSVA